MYRKEICYDREVREYAMYLDGELVGFAHSYHEAEVTLDQLVFELMSDTAAANANIAAAAAEQPTCAGQWCERPAGPSGFCDRCAPLLAPCERVVYTHCPEPCGAPVEIDGLCRACYAEHAPKHWPQESAVTTDLLSNGNLHIRINGLTLYCGSVETARQLHAALGAIFLADDEQADVDRLARHIRSELAALSVAPVVERVMGHAA